jgi:uncharacterized protein YjaZ
MSGKQINQTALEYFNKNESQLCTEFVKIMNDKAYHGWLYGGHKTQDGRPNDLGYAIGYKICAYYYAKSVDKKLAVKELLNINNFEAFLTKSGYLSKYL